MHLRLYQIEANKPCLLLKRNFIYEIKKRSEYVNIVLYLSLSNMHIMKNIFFILSGFLSYPNIC